MTFFYNAFKIISYFFYSVSGIFTGDLTSESTYVSDEIVYLFSVYQNSFHGPFGLALFVLSVFSIFIGSGVILIGFEPVNQVVEAV